MNSCADRDRADVAPFYFQPTIEKIYHSYSVMAFFYFIFLLEMIGEVACILHQPGETNNTIYNESQPSQPVRLAHRPGSPAR